METDGNHTGGDELSYLQGGMAEPEGAWIGFRATMSAMLLLELLLGVGGNLTVLVLYCGHCSLMESVSHIVTLSLHTLDLLLCVLCLPITATLLLLGGASSTGHTLLCCLHESAACFASVGTALNLLLISLDRYDISVRPANRLLTPRRATFLLAAVWAVSLTVPLLPFLEAGFLSSGSGEEAGLDVVVAWRSNSTELCVEWGGVLRAHLFLQVPVFLCSLVVMLFTYSRILQALRIRIGRPPRPQRDCKRGAQHCRLPFRLRRTRSSPGQITAQPRLIPSPTPTPTSPPFISTGPLVAPDGITTVTANTETNTPTPTVTTPLSPAPTVTTVSTPLSPTVSMVTTPLSPAYQSVTTISTPLSPAHANVTSVTTPLTPPPAAPTQPCVGVGASVSAILALRRAVRRHRDRRERQRRVFRMSVIIILSFLLCWAPLSITPLLLLALGPSDWLERLRLCFLVLAYWTVVLHPLLYAFTRQKLRRVLHTRLRRLRTRNTHTLMPITTRKRTRKHRLDCSDGTDRCLTDATRE